ncbi:MULTISPECIES: DNA mismatch repair protein MutS [Muribaculum]|uniref:DNA mismatch repair protein MutS n=3 Tax=Muribaculaceae TaxID=2005473 RepID=UPI00192DE4AE|nr:MULTISPECIES: DNA mismatch repair protein MutS [Muribaculum]MCX4277630.1 DNA mismatch repair protein MutS [Muribaculum sp.]
MAAKIVETPLMKQYIEMKQKHPDAILLFRVGDFYETFSDDAIVASEILGITLTRRANGVSQYVELAGFPHHALDSYLPKLVRAGKRVAICEQLEDPKLTKKLVKRGITELVTPGVSVNDAVLNHRENNFVSALHFTRSGLIGVAFLDISTGEFLTAEGNADYVDKLLNNFAPKEVLVERGNRKRVDETFSSRYLVFELDDWIFTDEAANDKLLKQFETRNLKGFGIHSLHAAIIASGAVLHYLDITKHTMTSHITRLSRIEEESYVRLDKFTVRNLELVEGMGDEGKSLLDVIDRTISPMGARLLRRWLLFPLKDVKAINARLDVVEYFFRHPEQHDEVKSLLEHVGDMERIISKVAVGRISPREVVQLRNALNVMEPLKKLCCDADLEALRSIGEQLNPCSLIRDRIAREIVDDAPIALNRGAVIKDGVDAELDELREIAFKGKDYLLKIQAREIEATGISSLKIGYNNVFGYYIEVTNTHKSKVPTDWIRKQTLVNAERYITQELKDYEEKILGAQEKIAIIETRLYNDLVARLAEYIPAIQLDSALVARLDVLAAFTRVAKENHYNRPVVDDSLCIDIVEGRHPVIERQLPPGEPYITNSVHLDNASTQVMMITGPNMSGKSALLRQTALNVIMAQIGCFVAADSARVGIVDKVFTRVGASDNISLGESTFMVEMNEAASILNNMSERSLILFDELGRGTSTYDGISIAWAIVEHIHEYGNMHPKTLFATHYHELNEMEASFKRVANYNVSVKEINGKVVFLRKLARGGSEHSFGIHVAKLAGMPQSIVKRADEVLHHLETNNRQEAIGKDLSSVADNRSGVQLSFFQLDDPVLTQIRDEILNIDINNLTPMAALNKLNDIRSIITGKA